jgi:hypothetical protein
MIVVCPDCRARVKVREDRVGTSIDCPSCDAVITVPDSPPRDRDDWDDERDYDRPRRRKRDREAGGAAGVWWVLGVLVALAVAGGVAYFLLRQRSADRVPATEDEARGRLAETRRHHEPTGGFSFIPPLDWTMESVQRTRFKAAVAPGRLGFRPNMNVVEERFVGSVGQYTDANLRTLRATLPGQHRVLSREGSQPRAGWPASEW